MLAASLFLLASQFLPSFAIGGDLSWHYGLAKRSNTKKCNLKPLGGGQDDGPNILKAMSDCKKNSVITLDGDFTGELRTCPVFPTISNACSSVGTLLVVTDLSNVEIKLSGTLQVGSILLACSLSLTSLISVHRQH